MAANGTVNQSDFDAAIRETYLLLSGRHGVGADKIVEKSALFDEFLVEFKKLLPRAKIDVDTVRGRLITLRKRGEDKGGLPKTQRRFNGRDNGKSGPNKPR